MRIDVFSRKDTLMVVLYSVLLLLSMTVQTGTVSMILCVLALLSLLGKKPLSRFEQRLSVPVLGLLAFAIVYGASAIYSPFGANAQSEFYKFIAAFSLAVILLARFDRKHVPRLLWGGRVRFHRPCPDFSGPELRSGAVRAFQRSDERLGHGLYRCFAGKYRPPVSAACIAMPT